MKFWREGGTKLTASLTELSITLASNSRGLKRLCTYSSPPTKVLNSPSFSAITWSTSSSSSIDSVKNGISSSLVRSGPGPALSEEETLMHSTGAAHRHVSAGRLIVLFDTGLWEFPFFHLCFWSRRLRTSTNVWLSRKNLKRRQPDRSTRKEVWNALYFYVALLKITRWHALLPQKQQTEHTKSQKNWYRPWDSSLSRVTEVRAHKTWASLSQSRTTPPSTV